MALTLILELLFLETLNTSQTYLITSKVRFVKGLANSTLIYIPNMIHICANIIVTPIPFMSKKCGLSISLYVCVQGRIIEWPTLTYTSFHSLKTLYVSLLIYN